MHFHFRNNSATRRRGRRLLGRLCGVFITLAALIPIAAATESDPLTLNLKDADIRAFIASMSELMGKNFVVDPRVQGKVTVISAVPTDPNALYQVFLSILKVHGFTAVPSGDVIKIVPEAIAKTQTGTETPEAAAPDEFVTKVFKLEHVSALQVVPVLQPLIPAEAHIAANPDGNSIVLSDTQANVSRIAHILARIDHKTDRGVEVIQLQHASAKELVAVLSAVNPEAAGAAPGTTALSVAADERTNSVLLGGNPDARLELRTLISHLDTPIEGTQNTEVIYLHYAVAKDLVPILQNVSHKLGGNKPAENVPATGAAGNGDLLIQADEATNALVVQAPPTRLRALKAIIHALDVRRAQVYVEGVIAEVGDNKAAELGIQWRTDNPRDGAVSGTVLPGVDAGGIEGLTDPFKLAQGFTFGFVQGGSIRALLRALANDGYTNVLSTPTLVTLDNEEAEIVVGQNVPFVTGQFTSTGTGQGVTNPFQTIERQDVGVLLKVKPQINEGDAVRLTIAQEVSSVERGTSGPSLITNKRSIKTNVLVDDGEIIVIGGLISDDLKENTQKVPLLGDIPVLGNLFRNRRSDVVKTNLMVFLRPTIIRDAKTAADLTLGKYTYIRDRQGGGGRDHAALMPHEPVPKLPDYKPAPPRPPELRGPQSLKP